MGKRIENPNYSGVWEHPQIPNPDYKADPELYKFDSNAAIGIEIWQLKSGSIFSNFLVSDDIDAALEQAKKRVAVAEAEEEQNKAADEAAAEAAKAAAEAEAADDEEE